MLLELYEVKISRPNKHLINQHHTQYLVINYIEITNKI